MLRFARTFYIGLIAVSASAGVQAAQAADQAIVVGVNQYPGLHSMNGTSPNLHGCVSDAQSMSTLLKKFGFQVTLLADTNATKARIREAFQRTPKADRFVFFFAGHGDRSTNRGAILLPHDALESSEKNDISANDLNLWVKAVPASRRTVLLDSCFSGGMLRSAGRGSKGIKPIATRYHPRQLRSAGGTVQRGSKDLIMRSTGADANESFTSKTKASTEVCYFVASRENEQAGEYDFAGRRHGVFTYFLTQTLTVSTVRWGDIQSVVTGKVTDHTEDEQHPTLSPSFVDVTVFDSKPKPSAAPAPTPAVVRPTVEPSSVEPSRPTVPQPPAVQPHSLWDDYNSDRVDRTKLKLSMKPDKTTIAVGEQIEFSASVQGPGYLVIVEKGTSGNINLLYPASTNAEDAYFARGTSRRVPADGFSFAPDAVGAERVRAILFSSEETAQKLLDVFAAERSRPRSTWSKDLVLVPTNSTPFITSDFTFEVVAPESLAPEKP